MLGFFGAVGGMSRFVQGTVGKIAGFFSGKLFGAKLINNLYI